MRKNIIDIKTNEKLSVREAARRFRISPNTVYKWAQAKSIRRKLGCNVEEAFKSHML